MQWNGDRNGGFSAANPQRLFLPLIIDPEYHYESLNVASESGNPSSLLWWMRRLIALRSHHAVFGVGEITFLSPENPKVLAFLRHGAGEVVLVVANLSRFSQPVELDLATTSAGRRWRCSATSASRPSAAGGKFPIAVGPHGFYWFLIEPAEPPRRPLSLVPEVRVASVTTAPLGDPGFAREMERRLPKLLPQLRWFSAKARHIRGVRVLARVAVSTDPGVAGNARPTRRGRAPPVDRPGRVPGRGRVHRRRAGRVRHAAVGPPGRGRADRPRRPRVPARDRRQPVRLVGDPGRHDRPDLRPPAAADGRHRRHIGDDGVRLVGRTIGTPVPPAELATLPIKMPKAEQSNSNVLVGERFILKLYRRLGDGVNPELEIGEHLTRVGFTNTASIAGAIEVVRRGGAPTPPQTLAVLLTFVPNQGDAWEAFLDYAQRFFEVWKAVAPERRPATACPATSGCGGDGETPPEASPR